MTLTDLLAPAAIAAAAAFAFAWAGAARRARGQQAQLERSEALRSAAEAELRAAEQRYLLALRGSQDGLWEWDLAAGVVQLSPRWKSMLGFAVDELADSLAGWLARVHADDRAGFEQALARQRDGDAGTRLDHELRLLHKDGSVRHVLSRGVAIRDEAGMPYRIVGLDTDVTRLRRMQAVLDAVAEGTAGVVGENFFGALVEHFARALEVDCAFVTECADDPPSRVRTLAFWSATEGQLENFEYALSGTPCEQVVNEGRACFHPQGLAAMFPVEAGFEAYLGMPIVGGDGRVLGHLALLHKRPLGDAVLVDRVYRIFLARAGAELERLHAIGRSAGS